MDSTYSHANSVLKWHLMDVVVNDIRNDPDSWGKSDDLQAAADMFAELLGEQMELAAIATFPLLWELLDLSEVDWHSLGREALEIAGIRQPVEA